MVGSLNSPPADSFLSEIVHFFLPIPGKDNSPCHMSSPAAKDARLTFSFSLRPSFPRVAVPAVTPSFDPPYLKTGGGII